MYLVDMGLAKRYMRDGTFYYYLGKHIPYKDGK